jgi:hypothetical protein
MVKSGDSLILINYGRFCGCENKQLAVFVYESVEKSEEPERKAFGLPYCRALSIVEQ